MMTRSSEKIVVLFRVVTIYIPYTISIMIQMSVIYAPFTLGSRRKAFRICYLDVSVVIVKGHGSSKATAVYNCVKQAYNMEKTRLCEAIGEEIAKLMEVPAEQPQE